MEVSDSPSATAREGNAPPAAEKWCSTQLKVVKLCFKWTIDNFSFCVGDNFGYVKSSEFFSDAHDQIVWCLYIEESRQMDLISIYLKLISSDKSNVRAKFKFCIIDANKEETVIRESNLSKVFSRGTCHGSDDFLSRFALKSQNFLVDDKLTISCEVQFVVDIHNVPARPSLMRLPKCKLVDNFKKLLNNDRFSDVTLVASGKEFKAHKAILSVRSEVFAAMFVHKMKESKTNRVNIVDIDAPVFREVLTFIYTDTAPNLDTLAAQVLPAADKYALEKLKAMCEVTLSLNLSVKSAPVTLMLADLHSANQLKARTIDFIATYASEVRQTEDWQKLTKSHSHLVDEVFSTSVTKDSMDCGPPNKQARLH